MLGLVFIYFIWKYFADLADRFKRNKWAWGIGAVAFYYACTFLAGIGIGILYLYQNREMTSSEELVIQFVGIGIAVVLTIISYYVLQRAWESKGLKIKSEDILD